MKKTNELGRTLLEMMAVLAIISLLTFTALQSYEKAVDKVYAKAAWESALKFREAAMEYDRRHPQDMCNKTKDSGVYTKSELDNAWLCMGDSSLSTSKYCFLDAKELLPSFADGKYSNFYMFINKSFNIVQFRNIRRDGLCSAILPDATVTGSGSSAYLKKAIGGVTYRCYRAKTSIEW